LSRLLWITDPWKTLDHPKDTTLRLVEECLSQGVTPWWSDVRSIRWEKGKVLLDAQPVQAVYPGRAAGAFTLGPVESLEAQTFSQLHYRTDPPVDFSYLHPLQLLMTSLEGVKSSRVVNPGNILVTASEKVYGPPELLPPGVVSSQRETLEHFLESERRAVLKPLHQAQSKGVELVNAGETEKLRAATHDFNHPILVQKYLDGIQDGEIRLWFLDGKLLSAVRKPPLPGDFRVNLDQGSKIAQTLLGRPEKSAASKIGRYLKARKIRLCAVDLIEGMVTDCNFTSPGLIPQMESLLGENLARPIVEALLRSK
jgi:glutathione synthetase